MDVIWSNTNGVVVRNANCMEWWNFADGQNHFPNDLQQIFIVHNKSPSSSSSSLSNHNTENALTLAQTKQFDNTIITTIMIIK